MFRVGLTSIDNEPLLSILLLQSSRREAQYGVMGSDSFWSASISSTDFSSTHQSAGDRLQSEEGGDALLGSHPVSAVES